MDHSRAGRCRPHDDRHAPRQYGARCAPYSRLSAFDAEFAREREVVDAALAELRPRLARRVPDPISAAVEYALDGPGKRVRGVLALVAHDVAGGRRDLSGIAAAIEVVHAYSLVHDDLPCMDNDDVRRGRPTVHRRFSVETATVAGLAMVPLAVLGVLDGAARAGLPPRTSATIVNELMRAAGGTGMIGGQLLDLEGEGRSLGVAELDQLHSGKTGALFGAAARIGALAAGAPAARVDALGKFAVALGLAFQITDDVLDVTASPAQLGKGAGRDAAMRKSTYPAAVGLTGAQERAVSVVDDAFSTLQRAGLATERLRRFAHLAVSRSA